MSSRRRLRPAVRRSLRSQYTGCAYHRDRERQRDAAERGGRAPSTRSPRRHRDRRVRQRRSRHGGDVRRSDNGRVGHPLGDITRAPESNGQTSIVAIANEIAGAFTVTATVSGVSTPGLLADEHLDRAKFGDRVSGGGQVTEVTTAFANPVVVSVADSFGNPVAGAALTVTLPSTGASATFTPASPTTDATGSVSIQFTANTITGAYEPAFSVAGGSSPASVALANTAIPTATVLSVSSTSLLEGETITLTAVVTSPTGTPAGTVTFFGQGTQLGQATITGGSAVLAVAAPSAPGVYSLTAVYPAQGLVRDEHVERDRHHGLGAARCRRGRRER